MHTASRPPYVTRCMHASRPPEQTCARLGHCLRMQAGRTVVAARRFNPATALHSGSLPSHWSAPPAVPLQAAPRGTRLPQAARCDDSVALSATHQRRSGLAQPHSGAVRISSVGRSGARLLSAANAAGGPALDGEQGRGQLRGGLLHAAASSSSSSSSSTAESTGRSGPGTGVGAMNGQRSFLSGYDDAWDSGSTGVGGHPPVAVITTLGCPHCKRVRTPLPSRRLLRCRYARAS